MTPGALVLALMLFALPLSGEAQVAGTPRQIGFLSPYSKAQDTTRLAALQQGLFRDIQAAAPALRVAVFPLEIAGPQEFDRVFSTIKSERFDALNILGGAAGVHRRRLADLSIQHRVPTISTTRESAEDGVLLSYGSNFPDLYRRAATYVDKILKGAKPGDLPIEQPTKFELVVNLKTAKALGLTIPQSLLLQAEHLIE